MEKFGDYLTPLYGQHHAAFLERLPGLQAGMDTALSLCVMATIGWRIYCTATNRIMTRTVIDWQGPLRARGMNDVALFLGQSTQMMRRSPSKR